VKWRASVAGIMLGTLIGWMALIETLVFIWVPAEWWVEIHSIHVHDARTGEVPKIDVSRTVHRSVTANWNKTVRRIEAEGLLTVCERTGSTDFLTEAVLPENVNLDWWMSGRSSCPTMQPGRYILTTVWLLQIPGRLPKELRVVSNPFEVTE
jgi:hypothetical protein